MLGLPSAAECLIVLLLALMLFGLVNVPKTRQRAVRVIEDLRQDRCGSAVQSPDRSLGDDIEWIVVAGLILAATGCIAVLVVSQSGWV